MSLEELAKLGEASATIGICIAIFVAWLNLRSVRADERQKQEAARAEEKTRQEASLELARNRVKQEEDKEILVWQKATVWKIIAEYGPLAFNDILEKYTTSAVRTTIDKKRPNELKEDVLQVVLLGLIESRAIHVLPLRDINDKELKYSIVRFDPAIGDAGLEDMLKVLEEIEASPEPIDEATLEFRLRRKYPPGQLPQIGKLLLRLEIANIISRDQDRKLIRRAVMRVVVPPGQSQSVTPGANSTSPAVDDLDLVRDQIHNFIKNRRNKEGKTGNFSMMPFKTLREEFGKPNWTDEFFRNLIDRYPNVFQPARLDGGQPGIKVI